MLQKMIPNLLSTLSKKMNILNGYASLVKLPSNFSKNLPVSFLVLNKKNPVAYIKVPRNPSVNKTIEEEYNNLSKIYQLIQKNESLKNSIPKPILYKDVENNLFLLIETYFKGNKFYNTINFKEKKNLLNQAVNWLVKFHTLTQIKHLKIDASFFKKYILPEIKYFLTNIAPNASFKSRLLNYLKEAKKFQNDTINISAIHGDFNHYNILKNKEKIKIIDWTDCSVENIAVYDLIHFAFMMFLFSNKGNVQKLDLKNQSLIDEYYTSYAKKMNINKEVILFF